MPDASPLASDTRPPATPVTSVSGGVNIDVQRDRNTGGDVAGCTVEQISTLFTQIRSTFQPRPFDGHCSYLGLDDFSQPEFLPDDRSHQNMGVFVAQEVDIE
jgi:hypothetical protein